MLSPITPTEPIMNLNLEQSPYAFLRAPLDSPLSCVATEYHAQVISSLASIGYSQSEIVACVWIGSQLHVNLRNGQTVKITL